MDALVGYTGFVGSHLIRENMDYFHRANIHLLCEKEYNTVYCSAVPAEKWKANKNPNEDKANIDHLIQQLDRVRCKRFVLISTVDVYDNRVPQCEDPDVYPNAYTKEPYGAHRRYLEEWVMNRFPDGYIFRLPALYGHGLKKNALFDMMHLNQVDKLRSHWVFQWYNVQWLQADMEHHISKEHHVVNLVTPPFLLQLIQTLFFPRITLSTETTPVVQYSVSSKYGYSHTVEDVLLTMAAFVRYTPRKLVSEIGWPYSRDSVMKSFLKSRGISSYEIVPSKRDWEMSDYSNVYSAQSILYGVNIQIFQEQKRFLNIIEERLNKLASVGTHVVVFGSPKQRIYSGEDAVQLFRKVGDLCKPRNILFCIENNARGYGGNWLHTLHDTIDFVRTVNHPNIRVSLDTGSMMMEDEIRVESVDWIGHVQISFPNLSRWQTETIVDDIIGHLKGYRGMVSLEMLDVNFHCIDKFVQYGLHLEDSGNLST
jgi:hypothetical protein